MDVIQNLETDKNKKPDIKDGDNQKEVHLVLLRVNPNI
jgi:hypothetical protein